MLAVYGIAAVIVAQTVTAFTFRLAGCKPVWYVISLLLVSKSYVDRSVGTSSECTVPGNQITYATLLRASVRGNRRAVSPCHST